MSRKNTSIALALVAVLCSIAALYLVWLPFPLFVSSISIKTYNATHPVAVRKVAFIDALRVGGNGNGEVAFDKLVALGADAATLRIVPGSAEYVRDAKSVYWVFPSPRKVEGADANSFRIWEDGTYRSNIAIDRAHLYITGVLAEGVDPKTFARVGSTIYFHDNWAVFYTEAVDVQNDYRYGLRKIPGANSGTIHALTNNAGLGPFSIIFAADAAHIYLRGEVLEGVDAKTFRFIAPPYFSDKDATYFFNGNEETLPMRIAATPTIRVFTNDSQHGGYVVIGGTMFFGTTTMAGADARSFHVFDADTHSNAGTRDVCVDTTSCPYAADANAVYYAGKKIMEADPSSFALIGYGLLSKTNPYFAGVQPRYARDAALVYYLGQIVETADSSTFTPLVSGGYYYEYGHDARAVYWQDNEIVGADKNTFHIFGGQQSSKGGCPAGPYSADARAVYFQTRRAEGADPNTFESLTNSYGRDKNGIWEGAIFKPDLPSDFTPMCDYG